MNNKKLQHWASCVIAGAVLTACGGTDMNDSSSAVSSSSHAPVSSSNPMTSSSSVVTSSSSQASSEAPPIITPSLAGITPGAEIAQGSSLTIRVNTNDDSAVKHVQLFLNDALVRRENIAPYDWNDSSQNQSDAALQNLSTGAYTLRAVVTDNNDAATQIEVQFTVKAAEVDKPLEEQVKEIFAADCTSSSCHDATPGGARIDLVTGTLEDFAKRIVGQPSGGSKCSGELIVDPNMPENSLFLKITDATAGDQCMAKMPFGKAGVTAEQHEVLTQWIEALIAVAPPIDPPAQEATRITPQALNATTGFSVAHYAKKMLMGSPLTNTEYQRIIDSNSFNENAYHALLDEWMATDKFDQKMDQFLRLALQQNASPLTPTNYWNQLGGLAFNPQNTSVDKARAQVNLEDMMVRTAMRIIDGDEDFRTILTTRDWEVNTIVLAALGRADQQAMKETVIEHKFYNLPDVIDSDYTDWRTITLKQSNSPGRYANETAYTEYLRGLQDGDSYELLAPRVGFFNSPSFIFNWETNTSNQFRLTLNQTLISTLGLSFEAGDTTPRNHHEGVIADHAVPGTDCFACHTQMDPMRNVFMKYYHTRNTRALANIGNDRPDFSFHGLSREVGTMDEFAQALADHPNFAFAWASKMCQWVTSVECEKKYRDDVQDIADKFAASGFKFKALLRETLKSPLVTNGITDNSTMLISIARQDHFCTHLEDGLADIAQKRGRNKDKTFCDKSVHYRAAQTDLVPNDEYTRGKVSLLQPSQLDPFYVKSVEYLCADRDWWFIGNNNNVPFHRDKTTQVLDDMTQVILGIPSEHSHYATARQAVEHTYDVLRKSPKCSDPNQVDISNDTPSCGYALDAQKAIETLWKMACSSPSTISVGLGF